MTKYNYHEEIEKVKKDPKYTLPLDINKPVFDFLEKIGCDLAVKELQSMQESLNYGQIEINRNDLPNVTLLIQVDCGMAGDWKDHETKKDENWTVRRYKIVKNYNLTKKKFVKEP
jgi:hypothetical protein